MKNYAQANAIERLLTFMLGTVPVYVAETVERRLRGNLVSAYQFNIALGEVFGYVVAAIFLNVEGNWRYILGSSVVFSTIMGAGYVLGSI